MGAHYERANVLFQQRRYAQAEQELRDELAENPNSGRALAFLGCCVARQKRFHEAVREGEEAVRLAPHLAFAHYLLGLTFINLEWYGRAEQALREALRLEPRNVSQLEWLSWVQFLRGDRFGAISTVAQGLAIDPQHVGCLNRRGYYLSRLLRWSDSETTIRAALALDPNNSVSHAILAWMLLGKYRIGVGLFLTFVPGMADRSPLLREATNHFQEALRLDPTNEWAQSGLLEVLLLQKTGIYRLLLAGLGAAAFLFVCAAFHPLAVEAGEAANETVMQNFRVTVISLFGIAATLTFVNEPLYLLIWKSRLGGAVLSPARRRAALCTIGCLAISVVAAFSAVFTQTPIPFAVAFTALFMIRPLAVVSQAASGRCQNFLVVAVVVLGVAALACLATLFITEQQDREAAMVVLFLLGCMGPVVLHYLAREMEKRGQHKMA